MSNIIQQFWKAHEQKVLIILAILLSCLVSFQLGENHAIFVQNSDIKINISASAANPKEDKIITINKALERAGGVPLVQNGTNTAQVENTPPNAPACMFVASKSSNKYHLPTCPYASKIKKENQICFSSEEQALQKGFQKAKCCHK